MQNPPNIAGAHYKFDWDFGDGTAHGIATDNPNIAHTYPTNGSRTVSVAITDLATGHVIARAGTSNNVGPVAPFIHFTVGGTWNPGTMPPIGFYQYTDFLGPRQAGTPTLDALLAEFNRALGDPEFTDGVTLFVVVPTGGLPTAGQVFTLVQSGAPHAGQFVLSLALDQSNPATSGASSPASNPGTNGTLTIDKITPVGDGSFIYEYSFAILSPTGGSIVGSGASHWQ